MNFTLVIGIIQTGRSLDFDRPQTGIYPDTPNKIYRRNDNAALYPITLGQCLHTGLITGRPRPDAVRRIFTFGDTNMRTKFSIPCREFVNRWSEAGPTHHMAAATGRHIDTILKVAKIFNIPVDVITR